MAILKWHPLIHSQTPNTCIDHQSTLNTGSVEVFSCGVDKNGFLPTPDFSQYSTLYGSTSLLKTFGQNHPNTVSIAAKAKENAKEAIQQAQNGEKIAILCSGDALYHGFGASLLREAEAQSCSELLHFHPHITAFQALFHRLGLDWSKARLFSAHHNDKLPLRAIHQASLENVGMSVIYGGTRYPAHLLAKTFLEFSPKRSNNYAIIAEYMGTEKEVILQGTLEELSQTESAPTSILVILEQSTKHAHKNWVQEGYKKTVTPKTANQEETDQQTIKCLHSDILPLGLPEFAFAKENNLITASDARAIILSRLRLPHTGVMWDLGAGSGSVGIEAAALQENLEVHAVEQYEKRLGLITENQKNLGTCNHILHHGDILQTIPTLPTPQRIFIGGGGKDLPTILDICAEKLEKNGILIVSAVTLESFHALHGSSLSHALKKQACLKVDIALEQKLAGNYHHFQAQNTLYIFIFTK